MAVVEVSQGVCDLCGAPSDASLQECNWLTCTFQHCEGGLYHQECLEKYLKQSKLEKNRKTGFKCPRGCGKGTKFETACPGRIDKSHPLHPRNEDKKKTKLAAVVVEPQRPAKQAAGAAQNGKVAKAKEDAKADAGKDSKTAAGTAKAASAAKAASPGAATLSPGTLKAAAKKEAAPLPPRPEVVAKQKLAELAAQARRELGLPTTSLSSQSSHGSKGDLQLLASSSSGSLKLASGAAPSAWGKPASAAAEPPAASPQPPMMSQLPQLQQLYQAASKKPAVKAPAAAVPAPAPASKPAPAVPQPVLNPSTPVWPALGSAQTSAAALLAGSGSSGGSGQAPREAAAARPASPSSVWGPAATVMSTALAAQQAPQQPSAPGPAAVASRPLPSVGSSGSLAPSAVAASASAAAPSASGGAAEGPSSSAGIGSGLREGTTAEGAEASTSGRGATTDGQQAAASGAGSMSAATSSQSLADATQQACSEGAEEEAKEQKLTKAQKKNLKRLEKKKGPQSSAAVQQGGSETPQEGLATAPAAAATAAAASSSRQAGTGAGEASASRVESGTHKRQGSTGSDHPERSDAPEAEPEATPSLEDLCVRGIVSRKVQSLVAKLQRLGTPDYVAAAAVQRHGSDLMSALEWLLVAGADAASAPPEAVLTAAVQSATTRNGQDETEVDISEELQQLSDVQAAMGAPAELLYQCVLDCGGDVAAAAKAAVDRVLSSAAPAAAAGGASRGPGRPSDGCAESLASLPAGSSMQLPASASYYSVSSLDTAASGLDHDQSKQHQQPAYSNRFGVRLVDEPVASSSGGYDGMDTYGAGLLRGGVVLGAAGWANGYLRDSPPQQQAAGGGRNTSRLLHWLRDERAAVLEEDSGSCNCGLTGSDPALGSPFSSHGDTARRQTASASPSLNNWLGSNGFHMQHPGPAATTTAGRSESQELFGANAGAFSFSAAAAEYGSAWGMYPAHRHDAAASGGCAPAGATEAGSAPHNDGDNDLSSIMALINTR